MSQKSAIFIVISSRLSAMAIYVRFEFHTPDTELQIRRYKSRLQILTRTLGPIVDDKNIFFMKVPFAVAGLIFFM